MIMLDIHCATCQNDGDKNPPRLVRFIQGADGKITPQPFKVGGQPVVPYPHERPDGGVTWQLVCPQSHDRPVRHERIIEAFDALASLGVADMKLML